MRLTLTSAALVLALACRATFTDAHIYTCASDADCGGDGFSCVTGLAGSVCCKPTGPEVCDKVDNDCDGRIDNTGKAETCNNEDDDCNGLVDETFHLQTDNANCGACGVTCTAQEFCKAGRCVERVEVVCYNGVDDDNDGKVDCDDPSCDAQPCGAACVCHELKKAEDLCSDGVDNDDDSIIDCFDPDCLGKACARGCTCVADGGVTETDCTDGVDNDLDTLVDCLDPDCVGQFCTPPQIYFSCTAAMQCRCNGGVQIAEVGSVLCRDDVDNDCNGVKDCGEATCDGQTCLADGGLGCQCANKKKTEKGCANLEDDDGDGMTDCADSDCAQGVSCTKPGGGAGMCNASGGCE